MITQFDKRYKFTCIVFNYAGRIEGAECELIVNNLAVENIKVEIMLPKESGTEIQKIIDKGDFARIRTVLY